MRFTKSQQAAINHRSGHLQLIACAGSGKTEVVARRIANLLDPGLSPKCLPSNIVAFTFTDKAAGELKQRIIDRTTEALGDVNGLAEMFVGTIHAFCLDLLKSEVPEYLKYEVLNEVQQVLIIERNSTQSGLTGTCNLDGTALRRYVDTKRYVQALSILREAELQPDHLRGITALNGLDAYRALLRNKRYLDYSSILEEAVQQIRSDLELRARLAERVKHVIVDEYQDLNPVQENLIRLLSELGADVCVVGDDDQTIYQWRGSNVHNILSFADRYAPVTEIRLQENFRSSRGIVETARDFISRNQDRLEKAMEPTDAQAYEAGDIVARSFESPQEEAEFIGETIRSLIGIAFADSQDSPERGLSYSDIAILLRSVKANGNPITAALDEAGIPYVVGGMNNLFDTGEAEAARQLFYFMAGRPISEQDLAEIWVRARLGLTHETVRQAISQLRQVRAEILLQNRRLPRFYIQTQFWRFIEALGLAEEAMPDGRGEVVFYNLGKFSQIISDFETIHFHTNPIEKYKAFANFLQYQADEAYPEGWQSNQYANPNAVRIMTVHQAKGMQWPVVFVPALLRNRFPAARMGGKSVWHILPRDGVADQDRYEGSIEDERRLFYVAMTRSQKFLFLTWAPISGNRKFQRQSEFWENVLVSKFVKRLPHDYSDRKRLTPEPKAAIANVTLSFSDLKYFYECPYQFKLRILYGFNPPLHEALGYGKSLHDALAEVHARAIRGETPAPTEASSLVQRHLNLPFAYTDLRQTLIANAERVVKDYLEDNAADFPNIEFSEKTVEISLGDGVTVSGRIDLVRRLDTDETTIVDLKSKDRVQPEDVTELQLHIYALGYQALTGRNADFVEVYDLDERRRSPRSVDDGFITEVQNQVSRAASSLRSNTMQAKASLRKCAACEFRPLCKQGKQCVSG